VPPKLIPYDEWRRKTDVIGRKRSAELVGLDHALRGYETTPTDANRDVVQRALDTWKLSQGPGDEWKKSARNKSKRVELLTTLLSGGADSDAAWGLQPNFMHDDLVHSRLGVLYLFSHMSVNPKLFNVILEGGLAVTGSFVSYAGLSTADGGLGNTDAMWTTRTMPAVMTAIGNDFIDGAWSSGQQHIVQPALRGKFESFSQAVRNWFAEFARKLLDSLKAKWNCELPIGVAKAVTNSVCGALLNVTAAGIVSGVLDTTRGVVVSTDAAITKFKAWRSGQDVVVAPGHPTAVVDAISRGMWMSLGEGMWQLLKGATNIGIAFGTAGAGLITGIVIAGAEMMAKVFYRLFEVLHMERFFGEAAKHWRHRDMPNALHRQPFAFGRWYRNFVLNTPALAVLTLNSGVCGDKMIWLSMFREDTTPISTDAFQKGVTHLDSLKVWGVDYLKQAGFSFRGTNEMANRFVQFSYGNMEIGGSVGRKGKPETGTAHPKNLSTAEKGWDWVVRAAKA
jgi:hypothetical protein